MTASITGRRYKLLCEIITSDEILMIARTAQSRERTCMTEFADTALTMFQGMMVFGSVLAAVTWLKRMWR